MNKRKAKKNRLKLYRKTLRKFSATELTGFPPEPYFPYPCTQRVTATEGAAFNNEIGLLVKDWIYVTREIYTGDDDLVDEFNRIFGI